MPTRRKLAKPVIPPPAPTALTQALDLLAQRLRSLDATGPHGFEGLLADLFGEVTGQSFLRAKSGTQGGADLRTLTNQLEIGVEAKRYEAGTSLPLDQLQSKLVDAAQQAEPVDIWVLAATRAISGTDQQALIANGQTHGLKVLVLDWPVSGLPRMAVLCGLAPNAMARRFAGDAALATALATIVADDRHAAMATTLKAELLAGDVGLKAATAASELGRRGAASKYDNLVADISRKIGFLDSQIDQLNHRVALAEEIATLTAEKEQLNERISRLKAQIETTSDAQTRRKQIAYTAVSENVKRLIARDLPEHNDYGDVRSFSFDFAGDWMAINGDKNRVGSASGMVVLKNSFLLSLFISSLNDAQFNLPRFMLMDNIEDKGMVQERSWNFQRLIVKASEDSKADHQIIFSTSKIAPELEGSAHVIGGKYTKQRRTLRIGN